MRPMPSRQAVVAVHRGADESLVGDELRDHVVARILRRSLGVPGQDESFSGRHAADLDRMDFRDPQPLHSDGLRDRLHGGSRSGSRECQGRQEREAENGSARYRCQGAGAR